MRIAISTGGGDAPGLNAVIRAVVLSAYYRGWRCYGIQRGYEGLLSFNGVVSLGPAEVRGLTHLGWATIITARTAIEARVLVTERIPPLRMRGRTVHQVGLPYHWGPNGLSTGDAANELLSVVLDPNVDIQESKAASCDIVAGRRPRGPALLELVEDYRRRGGLA